MCSPAGCSECRDPGLEDPGIKDERVFSCHGEEYDGQDDSTVDHEANHHRHHVHAELLCHRLQVTDGGDLSTDQRSDPNWRVPKAPRGHQEVTLGFKLHSHHSI